MTSVQEAEQIVRRLTRKYGFLNEKMMDDIEQFNAAYRRDIDENWLAMESAVSHSVKILAKKIYGSGARFVFELLQNAEDNMFNKARASDALPFISFKIYPDKIVVECNEDGFTEPDLDAICAVGKSTKSASHGYIGAKGIGFKSVFIAASRVHIQSGNFSFEFRHNKTDPGIGMVRPIWVKPTETIPSPMTRMTLYIHDQGDPDEIRHLKRIISMQFDDLQETCLLFLHKLEQIGLEFYDENGELERSRCFRKHEIDEYRVSLETISDSYGDQTTRNQIYHITRQTATNLAPGDNRELSNTDDGKRAEVVLAFPITEDSKPLVTQRNQDLFAFLPLRRSEYKFLIHSDFDTNANRQDIITTSRRNLDLRGWIATAFYQAVLQFCKHPQLCYTWPMFLPSPNTSNDAFWSGLDHDIQDLVKNRPVLRSRTRMDLRLIEDIAILTGDAKDAEGLPLFDDPVRDLFLSPSYSSNVVDILKGYGLKRLSLSTVLDLLEADIQGPNSRFHGVDTSDEWHSAVACLLSDALEGTFSGPRRLKSLPLLPLRSGTWTSATSGIVYFPTMESISIPKSLHLNVLDLVACKSADRNSFFEELGVRQATADEVRASIFRSYKWKSLSFVTMNAYLTFLYLTHQTGKHVQEDYAKVQVSTSAKERKTPHDTDVYLPGTHDSYSPKSLLAATGASPGLYVDFLRSGYVESPPDRPNILHPSWEEWLCTSIGIRERLRIVSRDGRNLSDAFLYIHEHRPEKFLGLFEHLWLYEKSSLMRNQTLRSKIEDLAAQSLCGVDFSLKLKETWLPTKLLRELVDRYMDHREHFPFLDLDKSGTTELGTKWNFLSDYFSVRKDDTVDFLLEILRCIERSCSDSPTDSQIQKVFDLYVAIYAKLAVTSIGSDARRKITDFFEDGGIVVPYERDPTWAMSSACLWVAPPDMIESYSLRDLYVERVNAGSFRNIENLFKETLQIRDASWNDLVAELITIEEHDCEEISRLQAIYDYLHQTNIPLPDLKYVQSSMLPGWKRAFLT
ncbi:hypothetical protein ACHAPK_001029 [Fusarium culmorum]